MAEYIDRQAVEKFIEDGLNNPDKAKRFGHDAIEIMAEIHFMDAAEVVPVVRCKNCKYNVGTKKCLNSDSFFAVPKDDDFCSYGERRESDT